jgi:carbamoyltransferase
LAVLVGHALLFNVRGAPLVCTPEAAFRCFMGTNIERPAVGNRYLRKETQDRILTSPYHKTVAAD